MMNDDDILFVSKKALLILLSTPTGVVTHWRHYYYNPLKNSIDCPRSGSITIADFGWISFDFI